MAVPSLPADTRSVPPSVEPPAKVFTLAEADALLTSLETIFEQMDHSSIRLREVLELLQDLEEYWGTRIEDPELPERERFLGLVRERDDLQGSLQEDIERIRALGPILKDYQQGLLDFYGFVEGRLVLLCWERGP